MKVIFCDIDGVLNSSKYDASRDLRSLSNIDESRMPILKSIIDATGAKVVLTSSWRRHWDKFADRRDSIGAYIDNIFAKYGIEIYDKTEDYGGISTRVEEIREWLEENDTVNFVILDDYAFGWEELSPYFIQTDYYSGGLGYTDAARAIAILTQREIL